MKLHIIWDKEQIRYYSYLPKYATHTFLIPNIQNGNFTKGFPSENSRSKCNLLGLTSQKGELTK